MKTLLQITLLIITTMMFFSCQKWNQVSVEGHIYEYGTDEPVENATVSLYEFVAIGGSYYFIDSVHTNANGYYEYHNLDEDMLYVSLEVKKENYFTIDYYNPIEYYFTVNTDDIIMDVKLDPEAYLTINIVDNPEIDAYGVNIHTYFTNQVEYYSSETNISGILKANRYNEIFTRQIMKNTENIVKEDSIYLQAFEEKTYTIEF